MYDEVTRQPDHLWASLTYAQEEGDAVGHAEGLKSGIERGRRVREKYVDFPNKRWLYFSKSCC